jgi:hypothetical protein
VPVPADPGRVSNSIGVSLLSDEWRVLKERGGQLQTSGPGLPVGELDPSLIVMPSVTEFLFQVGGSEVEARQMPDAELRPIPSSWGHVAGFGVNPPDNELVDAALTELLAG